MAKFNRLVLKAITLSRPSLPLVEFVEYPVLVILHLMYFFLLITKRLYGHCDCEEKFFLGHPGVRQGEYNLPISAKLRLAHTLYISAPAISTNLEYHVNKSNH